MKKIIYFDETSATDYVEITDGGKKEISKNNLKEKTAKIETEAEAKVQSHGILPFINFGVQAKAGASGLTESIIKTYISNTILTDFLLQITKSEDIAIFKDLSISVYPNSMSYMKMYSPYLKMLQLQDIPFDFTNLDSILEGAKGYYELLAKTKDGQKIILRFNIKAFRNNYGLSDILKMDLTYYTVLVGKYPEEKLSIEKELPMAEEAPDALRALNSTTEEIEELNMLKVYDVVLAGVGREGK